jgi:hypothetical protein
MLTIAVLYFWYKVQTLCPHKDWSGLGFLVFFGMCADVGIVAMCIKHQC